MEIIAGGVTAAKGFEAAAAEAQIKYKDRKDMALVYSQVPCVAAGTFTTNVVKAAPVKWDQEVVYGGAEARAVVINSGIANACTGAEGYGDCKETSDAAAKALGVPEGSVLVASTGVIGMQLPIDRIVKGISLLAESKASTEEAGLEAAKAIMTTDTKPKYAAARIRTAAYLGFVSVVMIAFAASRPASSVEALLSARRPTPFAMRSIGSCMPITPVDATSTELSGI